MDLRPRRRALGGAITAAFLAGCSSRSPFTDDFELGRADAGTTASRLGHPAASGEAQRRDHLPELGPGATLERYLRYAALNSAELEAMFQDWTAALERLPQVAALPDPRLTWGYYLNEAETRVGPMRHTLNLAQTFPWFGKLEDRRDAAARHANAAGRRFEAARLELFLRVERAYNELFYLRRSIDITDDTIELLEQLERVARARYRVAAAGHPDLIRLQVELGTLEDRGRQLRDLRGPYTARLNAALNRPAGAAVPWPDAVSERVTEAGRDRLLEALRAHNPELIALEEETERARIAAAIARKDGLPDLTVGLAWTGVASRRDVNIPENGDDPLLATLSVNLPLWREKYDAGVREAIARRLAAASRRLDRTNMLAAELEEALFEHRDARRRVELYRDTLIPKASESLEASLGSFEQGESDFLDLIDTERTLLEFQLALERARVDRATSYARLEQLVGTSLARLEARPDGQLERQENAP